MEMREKMKQFLGIAPVALSECSNVESEKGVLECDTVRKEDITDITSLCTNNIYRKIVKDQLYYVTIQYTNHRSQLTNYLEVLHSVY